MRFFAVFWPSFRGEDQLPEGIGIPAHVVPVGNLVEVQGQIRFAHVME